VFFNYRLRFTNVRLPTGARYIYDHHPLYSAQLCSIRNSTRLPHFAIAPYNCLARKYGPNIFLRYNIKFFFSLPSSSLVSIRSQYIYLSIVSLVQFPSTLYLKWIHHYILFDTGLTQILRIKSSYLHLEGTPGLGPSIHRLPPCSIVVHYCTPAER